MSEGERPSCMKTKRDAFLFLGDTCALTPISNIKKRYLVKEYKKEFLGKSTLWKSLKGMGELERFGGSGSYTPLSYLKLGYSHYAVSLLKEVNLFICKSLTDGEWVWLPKKKHRDLIIRLMHNRWALIIAPCNVDNLKKQKEASGNE